MEVKLSADDFLDDKWIDIVIGENHRLYVELDCEDNPFYFEIIHSQNGKTLQGFAFDRTELEKLKPKRLRDPSYFSNDPLCPSCGTYMIYNFEYCPKCGQKIDYSEK